MSEYRCNLCKARIDTEKTENLYEEDLFSSETRYVRVSEDVQHEDSCPRSWVYAENQRVANLPEL